MSELVSALIAEHPAEAPAIGAPGREWLTYGRLRALSARVADSLAGAGIGAEDRVAIVLPNGPEMASAFVAASQAAAAAPLNPALTEDEFAFHLGDTGAGAVILAEGYDGPALAAAERLGLATPRLSTPQDAPAGSFELDCPAETAGPAPGAGDHALILHTSGTTSRPKIVPLTQRNLHASALNIVNSLSLTSGDRCLNVMPLFHIHGLVAAVLASLAAGGRVWCAPGFDALRFRGWLSEAAPTWYTAVPTMHQAILARAGRHAGLPDGVKLRFARSSSASLPARVMEELEEALGAPVIESYGMTEAAHQMCSNPLPPRARKPGSVGVEAGPLVRIAHESEDRLIEGVGEVAVSGPNVTPGYEGNPEANAESFFEAGGKRWFRTGDQGAFDDDGFLRLTGRLKEIINRGGEKVSPLEVDGVLMDHPAVRQVVTFALPHDKLGEEVAAACVLRDGMEADERGIREFAAARLAPFKVPRRVVILDEIPKGATGKLRRIGLARELGLA